MQIVVEKRLIGFKVKRCLLFSTNIIKAEFAQCRIVHDLFSQVLLTPAWRQFHLL